MSRLWLTVACAAAFALAWTQSSALEPLHETGVFPIDPPTPYIHYLPDIAPRGRVVVVHGLSASKEFMQTISAALADGGFDTYDIDLPGHGDSPKGFAAPLAQQAIDNVVERLGKDTMVVGHSLGSGLLLDLAAQRYFPTLVLISPPPTPLSEIHANRVLVVSPQFDIPRIKAFAPIVADIGSSRVELWDPTWAGHSTALFRPAQVRYIVEWLGGNSERTRTSTRLAWMVLLCVSGAALGVGLMPGQPLKASAISVPTTLVRYVASCGAAILVLKFGLPLVWLRLFGSDYLISFLLLTGMGLCIQRREVPHFSALTITKAAAAAAFVIVVFGFIAGFRVLHIALSDGRWWRFPFIAAASFPLFWFDELTIRRINRRWKSAGIGIVTRALLWSFLMTGVLLLNRQSAFLVLIAHLVLLFWIVLWFAAGVVRRHTQDPAAAALFAAIVQGWAFAAWFVTI